MRPRLRAHDRLPSSHLRRDLCGWRAGEVYKGVTTSDKRLRAMVCYYGQHYMAYVQPLGQRLWSSIDDANQRTVRPPPPFPACFLAWLHS